MAALAALRENLPSGFISLHTQRDRRGCGGAVECGRNPFPGGSDLKIAQARQLTMSLPEVEGKPHFDLWSFRVAGKIFATVPPDEEHLHVFVGEEERERWIGADPAAFQPLLWGAKIVGLRVVLAKAKPSAVEEILRSAWRAKAPKRLVDSKPG